MTNHARRRLIRDFKKLQSDPPYGVSGAPMNNDIMKWQAVILGPDETSWEGGTFQLELFFSDDYPNRPPDVRFVTDVFHPNVYMDGNICLDILHDQWSPVYDISAILTSIQSLLSDPNPNSPANSEAARLYSENRREYNRRVQQCVADSLAATESTLAATDSTLAATEGTTAPATSSAAEEEGGRGAQQLVEMDDASSSSGQANGQAASGQETLNGNSNRGATP